MQQSGAGGSRAGRALTQAQAQGQSDGAQRGHCQECISAEPSIQAARRHRQQRGRDAAARRVDPLRGGCELGRHVRADETHAGEVTRRLEAARGHALRGNYICAGKVSRRSQVRMPWSCGLLRGRALLRPREWSRRHRLAPRREASSSAMCSISCGTEVASNRKPSYGVRCVEGEGISRFSEACENACAVA